MLSNDVRALLEYYPRVFHACHTRHVRDPETRNRVSARQASILDHLDEIAPVTLASLAQHCGVTSSTMSLTIDRLEKLGYVRRVRSQLDTRRVELTVTRAGGRLRDAQSVLEPERVRALLKHLTPEQRSQALAGLALLAQAADEHMHDLSVRRTGTRW